MRPHDKASRLTEPTPCDRRVLLFIHFFKPSNGFLQGTLDVIVTVTSLGLEHAIVRQWRTYFYAQTR